MQMAEACGCDVVAEGIENEAQLEFLVEHGCQLGQGYHLARPLPPDEVAAVLEEHLPPSRRSAVPSDAHASNAFSPCAGAHAHAAAALAA